MPDDNLLSVLNATHPLYDAQVEDWKRYRAFGQRIADKKEWLPRGEQEDPKDYETRIGLTHSLGFSRAATRRIVGALTTSSAVRQHDEGGTLPANIIERIEEFETDVDRSGLDIEGFHKIILAEALTMGAVGVTLDKDPPPVGEGGQPLTPADEGEDPLPYATQWMVEEVIDWEKDDRGVFTWVKLNRDISSNDDPMGGRKYYHLWRIYDRQTVREWTQEYDPKAVGLPSSAEVIEAPAIVHGLNMVPFAVHYGRYRQPMVGESYIDELSLADWRKLQYDSDQAMASYKHGSPRLAIKTRSDLDEIGVGTSHVLKLNAEEKEDAFYLENDPVGMKIREDLIESTVRQGFNLAGIDPAAVTAESQAGGGPRSGTSLAMSFSTAEAPALGRISEEMERFELTEHEILARYLTPGELPGPHVRVYDGSIRRVRSWDLMSAERAVDLANGAWDLVKIEEWRKAVAQDLASKIPGNLPEDKLSELVDLIEKSSDFEIVPPPEFPAPGNPVAGQAEDEVET